MLKQIFNGDNIFFRLMSRIADLMCLNILYIAGCVPVVTIGVSTCAMYGVLYEMNEKQNTKIIRTYFKYYRRCLKQGLLWELVLAVIFSAVWLGYQGISLMDRSVQPVFQTVYIMSAVIGTGLAVWSPSLIAWFDSGFKTVIKNAVFITVGSFHWFLVLIAVDLVPWICLRVARLEIVSFLIPIMFLFGISLLAYINTYICKKAYRKYENLKYVQEGEGAI